MPALIDDRDDHQDHPQHRVDLAVERVEVAAQRGHERRDQDSEAGGAEQDQAAYPGEERVGAPVLRHRPGDVHRVLGRLRDSQRSVDDADGTDHDRRRAPLQTFGSGELVADHRELAQRGVEDLLLEVGVVLQHEAEDRRGHQQQREQRQEAVVGHQRGQVVALIVAELVDDRDREAEPLVPPLVGVEAIVKCHRRLPVAARRLTECGLVKHGSSIGDSQFRWRHSESDFAASSPIQLRLTVFCPSEREA